MHLFGINTPPIPFTLHISLHNALGHDPWFNISLNIPSARPSNAEPETVLPFEVRASAAFAD
jgi:hypothetical protein